LAGLTCSHIDSILFGQQIRLWYIILSVLTNGQFLEKGKLIEMGTHDELVKIEGGKYAHLFRLQSEGYASIKNDKNDKKD
jgi:hypothetical protein